MSYLIKEEVDYAKSKYGYFNSTHEVYGVIKEELDEFWDLVKMKPNKSKTDSMIKELHQVAAVAIRAAKELEEGKIKWV